MTDFYCDHGAYSSALGTTPTWGVPQEGDGTSISAATAASVVSVDLTSITSTAGTFSLFGSAAVSVGASASGATLATQIAAAINGSSVTTGNTTIFPGSPQLRNAFYATTTGATLNIMCRIGSALTNVLGLVWGGTWSAGPPSNLTFAGGSGGCWGWYINPAAIGVAGSIALLSYGVWLYAPYCGTLPTLTDTTYIRTGEGKTITLNFLAEYTTLNYQHGNFPGNLVFDSNTKWTSDSGNGVFKLVLFGGAYIGNISFSYPGSYPFYVAALKRGGYEIECTSTAYTTITLHEPVSGEVSANYCNVKFRDSRTNGTFIVFAPSRATRTANYVYENCDYVVTTPRANADKLFWASGYDSTQSSKFIGCTFDFNISGLAYPGDLLWVNGSYDLEFHLALVNCAFLGYAPKYKLSTALLAYITSPVRFSIVADNCTGLQMPSSYFGIPSAVKYLDQNLKQIIFSDESGMRVEDVRGVAEWVPSESPSFPTLSAARPGSGVPWSLRLVWMQVPQLSRGRPFQSPSMRMYNQLSAGVKVCTLQLFVPSTVSSGVHVAFGYIDATGIARCESSELLQSSSSTWTNAGSFSGYVSKKVVVTTSYSVAANSEVTCLVALNKSPDSTVVNLYVDPEFTVV